MKPFARRIRAVKPSPTLAITAQAGRMRAQGIDIASFGAGEPDFNTPKNICDAAVAALAKGQTKYTPVDGTPELKTAICAKLRRDNGLEYAPDQIIVSCGGKHSLYNIAQVLFDAGDEIIIPAPYWVSYPDQALLNDAKPVFVVATDKSGFKITADQLAGAITNNTKAVIINSPSNPTGAAYSRTELAKLGEICVQQDVWVISDEIYEKVVYDGFQHFSIASLSPKLKERTIVVNGASKVYAMTGWRMGFAAGPKDVIKAMAMVQGQVTSNISSITQAACVEAYNGPQDAVTTMVAAFKERRDFIVAALNAIPGIRCNNPEGAFYVFPNISKTFGKKTKKGKLISNADDFCNYLLEDFLVAAVAGGGFGLDGYIRLSYATGMETIKKGLTRIRQAVEELR